VQRAPDLVLTIDPSRSPTRSRSALNAAMWAVAAAATIVLGVVRAEAFWLLAALVAGLSLSGSV